MNKASLVAGIILAGGESRRFGSPKAFAKYDGAYFYEYAIQALQQNCETITIVSHPAITKQFPKHLTVIEDEKAFKGDGPLAGIHAVMSAQEADWYMVLPCDMPFITSEIMTRVKAELHTNSDAVLVRGEEKRHPLVGAYHKRAEAIILQQLRNRERKMMKLLQSLNVKWLSEQSIAKNGGEAFQNINRPLR
ncbi:molybdenum cofactor guanylyltransferase [Bacillus tianshenii]|nr:molybdenum cofactor guanylyltransferase [Bacillus tianshenii]